MGSLLTAAFVKDARSFIRTSGRPLLATPKQVAQTMYWYDSGDQGYLLTLGEWTHEPPPAPSWRELLVRDGIPHQTKDEIENVWLDHAIWPEDFDKPVCERSWWDRFEIEDGPCAKAYHLLEKIDLGQTACQVECLIWTLISAHIPAATGSMPRMSYRCPCCRRASST